MPFRVLIGLLTTYLLRQGDYRTSGVSRAKAASRGWRQCSIAKASWEGMPPYLKGLGFSFFFWGGGGGLRVLGFLGVVGLVLVSPWASLSGPEKLGFRFRV